MKSLILFIFGAVLSLNANAATGICPPSQSEKIDDFFSFIQSEKIHNSPEFFEKVRQSPCYSGLLQNPILNPVSFALHGELITPQFPRILIHENGLTLMMVGNPKEPSSNILEIITFDSHKKKFLFSLVNFNASPEREFTRDAADFGFAKEYPGDTAFKGILQCAFCHKLESNESIPRWGMPPLFQVPFGQANEVIYAGSAQMAKWTEFQKTFHDADLGKLYRYLDLKTQTLQDGSIFFERRPNSALSAEIEKQNIARVGRVLQSAANYPRYQFALIAVLLDTTDIKSYLSASTWSDQLSRFTATVEPRGLPNKELFNNLKDPTKNPLESILQNIIAFNFDSAGLILNRVNRRISSKEKFDLTGVIFGGKSLQGLPQEEIIQLLMADQGPNTFKFMNIRFLFEDSVSEKPVSWSTHKPYPFGESYRFSPEFFNEVLEKEIGPGFLKAHPELNFFKDGRMTAANLTIPLDQFLAKLQAYSLQVNGGS